MLLLKYIHGIMSIGKKNGFSSASFDTDGHKALVHAQGKFSYTNEDLTQLRAACSCLLHNIHSKYSTLRLPSNDASNHVRDETCVTDDMDTTDESSLGSSVSRSDDSLDTDSDWTNGDNNMEVDEDVDELGPTACTDDRAVDRTPSQFFLQRTSCSDSTCCSDDDDEPPYDSTSAQRRYNRYLSRASAEREQPKPDGLFCPGDVVEYQNVNFIGVPKRAAISTIKDSKTQRYIVLDNGCVLRPKLHIVKKVRMYCGASGNLIPNPLGQWHHVEKCTLQPGALIPDDVTDGCDDGDDESDDDSYGSEESSVNLGYVTDVGRKRQRARTGDGLTTNKVTAKMAEVRRWNNYMKSKMPYPKFAWTEQGTADYYRAIDTVNDRYCKMLQIGNASKVFRNGEGVCAMLRATTKQDFYKAAGNVQLSYKRYCRTHKTVLRELRIRTELLPNPRHYQFEHIRGHASRCTNRQTIVKEQILKYEHYLANLNILKCSECLECNVEEKPIQDESTYKCESCTRRKDPNFFLDNNLHPVWYLTDDDGNYVKDDTGNPIPQFHIPDVLKRLSMGEKLLIRRCANMVPSVHIRSGIFGLKGHCVTFPQDISQMCDELPQRSESIVTFIRNIGNKETTGGYPTMLKVKKKNVIDALLWLKKHNPFYKNITINESNLDWMKGKEVANIASVAQKIATKETSRSKLKENEEEYVSRCHAQYPDAQDEEEAMPVAGMHANEKPSIPTGRQAEHVKELIATAKRTGQTSKVMQFPPIDHDSAIS